MPELELTVDLDPDLTQPFGTRVFTKTYRGRTTLYFDHYHWGVPDLSAVEVFHLLGWDHCWNHISDAHKRRGMYHGTSGGTWVSMPLLPGEEPLTVAAAVLTAWVSGDTNRLEPLTRRRIDTLPPASDYRRGQDIHVRFADGRYARVWSHPKRGRIQVRHPDGTAEEVETLG